MKLNFGIKFIPLCSEVDSKELSREDLGPPMDTLLASLRTGETGLLFSHASLDLAHHRRAASQPRACGLPSPSHRGLPTLATQGEQPGAPCLILSRSSADNSIYRVLLGKSFRSAPSNRAFYNDGKFLHLGCPVWWPLVTCGYLNGLN